MEDQEDIKINSLLLLHWLFAGCIYVNPCVFLLWNVSYLPLYYNNLYTYLILPTEIQSSCRQRLRLTYHCVFPMTSGSSCAINMCWIGWCVTDCADNVSLFAHVFFIPSQSIVWRDKLIYSCSWALRGGMSMNNFYLSSVWWTRLSRQSSFSFLLCHRCIVSIPTHPEIMSTIPSPLLLFLVALG